MEQAVERIRQAFSESEFNDVYIVNGKVIIELKSGRNFELSGYEIIHQSIEADKEK